MPHTPGPWGTPYLDVLPNGLKAWRIDSEQNEGVSVIAFCYTGDAEITKIQESNAQLIAAAPELLEALKIAQARISDLDWAISNYNRKSACHGLIDAAIAKAEGGEG